jgi:hypothetical protein
MQKCEFGNPIGPPLEVAIMGTRSAGGGGKLGIFQPLYILEEIKIEGGFIQNILFMFFIVHGFHLISPNSDLTFEILNHIDNW